MPERAAALLSGEVVVQKALQAMRSPVTLLRTARWWHAALFLVIVLAILVRCYRLGAPVLATDEAFSWRLTEYSVPELIQRTAADVHPPLYYVLLKGWVAIWGTSPAALRTLSVLFGVLSIPVIMSVAARGWGGKLDPGSRTAVSQRAGLLGASLLAFYPTQVLLSRSARMYSLGVLLTGVTAWLLLRALHARARPYTWWAAYGVALGLLLYTHYYVIYTVLAQLLFIAGGFLWGRRERSERDNRTLVCGSLLAVTIAAVSFIPWLSIMFGQLSNVKRQYWIAPPTWSRIGRMFFTWSTGLPPEGSLEAGIALLFLVSCSVWVLWRRERLGWFFSLQAFIPWAFGLGSLFLYGQSLLVDRYLAFSQFALLGLWSVVWRALPDVIGRAVFAGLFALACSLGLAATIGQIPDEPPAVVKAVEFLRAGYQDGDRVLVSGPIEVNLLRYYAEQAGCSPLDVRCRMGRSTAVRHINHSAALASTDILWADDQDAFAGVKRVWVVVEVYAATSYTPPPGMKSSLVRTFVGTASKPSLNLMQDPASLYYVMLYLPQSSDASSAAMLGPG